VWVHAYHWLEANNLWQALVAWVIFTSLTAAVAWLPWKRHRKTEREIADSLDTSTPGGLTDLVDALRRPDRDENGKDDRGR
jgi:hypothetical protein